MASSNPGTAAKKTTQKSSILPKIDPKALGVAIAKGVAHLFLGKYEDLADDAIDVAASLNIKDNTPEALAYELLLNSLIHAIHELLSEFQVELLDAEKLEAFQSIITNNIQDFELTKDFLRNPLSSNFGDILIDPLTMWLERVGNNRASATTISSRLPGFIPFALHNEWSKNHSKYQPLLDSIDSPFVDAAQSEAAWTLYRAKLKSKLEESIFGEPFGLRQIYIPLNATYDLGSQKKNLPTVGTSKKAVVNLTQELDKWLRDKKTELTIRTICGGPGCGKSSFSKIYASHVFESANIKTILIPLHYIDPTKDFCEEVGRFVRDEGILKHNPILKENLTSQLLIILDGLDELASQGQAAAITAKNFVRSVQQTIDRLNMNGTIIRVLFSGREVVVQGNETEFRKAGQILTILPYHTLPSVKEDYDYEDPDALLDLDLTNQWWSNYGKLTGRSYSGLPAELQRRDLAEITAQPLLNYLLALSYCRGKLNFNIGVNLNEIYSDLVDAIYERGYEKGRKHESIRSIDLQNFLFVLEEIGLAAWHGDGRSTTVGEIENYCREGGFGEQLDAFQDGAKAGITSLLAAFFFRQHGSRPKGDPTFVFTHKSFGEYLAARRIVRAVRDIVEEKSRRETIGRNRGRGWNDTECLKHWAEICGPTAMSPNILAFVRSEVMLMKGEECENAQSCLTNLFNIVLSSAMPMETLTKLPNFESAMFQARNAEEALLATLNACALKNQKISNITHPTTTTFGTWFKRIQEQRNGPTSCLASKCLSWLNLDHCCFDFADLWNVNLSNSTLRKARGYKAMMGSVTAKSADFSGSDFQNGYLNHSIFENTNFTAAILTGAEVKISKFENCIFVGAFIDKVDFSKARVSSCDFTDASKDVATSDRMGPPRRSKLKKS
ncbi:pentapeptide repeat-containing protein [Pseudomonas putida]|nr:pentapeptide repeat-containing protein [Pseudomonas putida]